MTAYKVVSFDERQDWESERYISQHAWPEFMLQDPISNTYFRRLYSEFPAFQYMLYDEQNVPISVGNSIPFAWDGTEADLSVRGWDDVLERGFRDKEAGRKPTAVSALAIMISRDFLGKGLSADAVKAMRSIARKHGYTDLLAPVRPNQKHLYPLTSMDDYIQWKHIDGKAPFDAWIRVHWRLGAQIVKICSESMIIPGTVAQWETWTGMRFPQSGDYIVPGALQPITINSEQDQGIYTEPNVWMHHRLSDMD